MRKRLISLALALLYFSVSIAFAGPHSHDHSKALSDQCVICAWHLEANADTLTSPILVSAPTLVVIHTPAPDVRVESSSPRAHADRGPPVRS